jgi:hypothetical protein
MNWYDMYDNIRVIRNKHLRRIGFALWLAWWRGSKFIKRVEFLSWLVRVWWFQPRSKWYYMGECRFGDRYYHFWYGEPIKWEKVGSEDGKNEYV